MTLQLRGSRKDLYIPCKMTTNNSEWDWGWFYLRNDDGRLLAYTGKVLLEKPDAWSYGVSPPRAPGEARGVKQVRSDA